jgi:RNA polymerase sigma-70 factor, ECF subfamily
VRSDEELVAAFVGGDRAAFDELVGRYSRRVYGICLRYFGDPSEAEDAAQETFVVLFRRASTYRGGSAFSTWLYRVTMNVCHDLGRRRARRPQPMQSETADDRPTADDVLANRELGLDLEQALRTLDPEQREAVVLHDVAGVPYADIAARLGVPVGTIKSRIARGHARLASVLVDRRPTEPNRPSTPPTVLP